MKYARISILIILLVSNFCDIAYNVGGETTIQEQLQAPFIETLLVFILSVGGSLGIMFLWSYSLRDLIK